MTTPIETQKPRSTLLTGLRQAASALAFGFLCAGLFALAVGPAVAVAQVVASHLAQAPASRGALAVLVLGAVQAAICFGALALLGLLFEVAVPVGVASGLLAGGLPMLVLASAQGPEALLPARVLAARSFALFLCALAGALAARSAGRLRGRR